MRSCRCLNLKLRAKVGSRFSLDWLVALPEVLFYEMALKVFMVDAPRRQLEGCRVRVAAWALPLP